MPLQYLPIWIQLGAFMLAVNAGMINVLGLITVLHQSISHMTGNASLLAQAIIHHPSLLILDEPLNGVDPKGMHDFRQLMREIVQDGTSILISSHLLSEMELLADKIIEEVKITEEVKPSAPTKLTKEVKKDGE